MFECVDIQAIILIGGLWPDLICFWFKLGVCVFAHLFPDPTQSSICILGIIFKLRDNVQHAPRDAQTPDVEVNMPTL